MKIGRNDPCPCGSGKKYKRCCIMEAHVTSTENNATTKEPMAEFGDADVLDGNIYDDDIYYNDSWGDDDIYDDDFWGDDDFYDDDGWDDDDIYDDDSWDDDDLDNIVRNDKFIKKLFMNGMINMHMFVLEGKPHIKEYKKIRKLHGEILDSMMEFYHDGKFEQKIDDDYVPPSEHGDTKNKGTLFLHRLNFNFDTEVGAQAFADMFVYKPSPNMNCITEEYINRKRYRKPEKIEFLHSMLNSELMLFELIGTDYDEGYAFIKDVFTKNEYKLVDVGLSNRQKDDMDLYIYTRIITYHDISFSSGLNIVFRKSDPFIKDFIKRHKKGYSHLGSLTRFLELYKRYSSDPGDIDVTMNKFK